MPKVRFYGSHIYHTYMQYTVSPFQIFMHTEWCYARFTIHMFIKILMTSIYHRAAVHHPSFKQRDENVTFDDLGVLFLLREGEGGK